MHAGNHRTGTVGLVLAAALLLAAAGTARADFVLSGDLHLDVTTSHTTGYLYDTSTADLLQSGYISSAYVNDHARLRVLEYRFGNPGPASVENLYAYDTSAVDISDGNVNSLRAYDTSSVAMSGGEARGLVAYGSSILAISGGAVTWLGTYDSSTVDISGGVVGRVVGGEVGRFSVYDLRPHGPERVNISGGTVNNLRLGFRVEGSETFSFSGFTSVADLAPHGILASEGTVTSFGVEYIRAYDTSTVDFSGGEVGSSAAGSGIYANNSSSVGISGGSVNFLYAYDSSAVDVSGGSVSSLYAYDSSAVDMSGGSVGTLGARNTSTVDMSGGSVSNLAVFDVRPFGPERVNISGGTVDTLRANFRLEGSDTFSFSGFNSVADLAPHGIVASEGTVVNFAGVSSIDAYDTSAVDISGGSVSSYLYAYNSSAVAISGGSVGTLGARNTSTVDMSGGSVSNLLVYDVRPFGPERVNISGGTVDTLRANFRLEGSDTFSFSGFNSVADLAPHGIVASEGTVVNFAGVSSIDAYDSSAVDISGGSVGSVGGLNAYDTSTVNISGGSVSQNNALYANDSSTVTISGGSVPNLNAYDNSTLAISGGEVGGYLGLHAYDTSTVDFSGGEVDGLLYAHDTSTVDISGGYVLYIYAYGSPTVNISGGEVHNPRAWGSSTLNSSGGSVSWIDAKDSGTVNISGGLVPSLNALETSSVHISVGANISSLVARDSSTIAVSGGSVSSLHAYGNNTVAISGGSVGRLDAHGTSALEISGAAVLTDISAWDSTTIAMSGGSVSNLAVFDVRLFGPERVNISGGTVDTLGVSFRIEGGETFSFSGFDSVADLAPHGILASEGTVANFWVSGLDVFADSILDMTEGSVESLSSYNSSVVNLFGGTVGVAPGHSLYAYDSSTANLFGGSVSAVYAYDTSTVAFVAQDFQFGEGLSLEGNRVLGTGVLSGEWFDGTAWTITIAQNDSTASIRATPEPATMALLSLGGLALLLRKSR